MAFMPSWPLKASHVSIMWQTCTALLCTSPPLNGCGLRLHSAVCIPAPPPRPCPAAQRLLRAQTAWRVKQLQRAGWRVLLVPFYEMMRS